VSTVTRQKPGVS